MDERATKVQHSFYIKLLTIVKTTHIGDVIEPGNIYVRMSRNIALRVTNSLLYTSNGIEIKFMHVDVQQHFNIYF